MGVCVSIINKFLTKTFTLTKEGLIQAINKVKNIQRNNHFLCKSEYNLLLEMHIITSFHDENSSILNVFEFLFCEYTGRYFFDFLYDSKLIRTDDDIHAAVKLWCSDPNSAMPIYGHISFWNTFQVTNMEELFMNQKFFNDDISDWDVSNVANMIAMFREAYYFNQPLATWNVSKVTNMEWMFLRAEAFNQPIGDWNVKTESIMDDMFYGATAFNQDISKWYVDVYAGVNN